MILLLRHKKIKKIIQNKKKHHWSSYRFTSSLSYD